MSKTVLVVALVAAFLSIAAIAALTPTVIAGGGGGKIRSIRIQPAPSATPTPVPSTPQPRTGPQGQGQGQGQGRRQGQAPGFGFGPGVTPRTQPGPQQAAPGSGPLQSLRACLGKQGLVLPGSGSGFGLRLDPEKLRSAMKACIGSLPDSTAPRALPGFH